MEWKDLFPKEGRYFETENGILYCADVFDILPKLPSKSIDCVITSPPYWALRDYGVDGQIGLEPDFQEYLKKLWKIFTEVYRILKPEGTCWVNLGDTYFSKAKTFSSHLKIVVKYPEKSLCLIPERFAIGMVERGWILRNQIIWYKTNAMPESVKDRFTVDFEKIFFFVKQRKYYFNQISEPPKSSYMKRTATAGLGNGELGNFVRFGTNPKGRNKRTVWSIPTKPFKGAHFASFPLELPEICIKAGCPGDGIVVDIFMGSGTTAFVAEKLNRKWIGIEINPEYCEIAKERILKAIEEKTKGKVIKQVKTRQAQWKKLIPGK
jgi:site-specific DNA-methyltransferase (adenine-specific)